MLGGATQAMPLCIVEERQQRRRPLARRAPFGLRPTGLRGAVPAGFVARSSHTAWVLLVARASPAGTAGRSPGGQQQSVHIISLQTLRLPSELVRCGQAKA